MSHRLKYSLLSQTLAVCQLAPDYPVPAWATSAGFFCVARTSDELSVVCEESRVPADVKHGRNWVALKLEGPFPFSMTGVLASFLQPLADGAIPIFAISTFDTDYVLVKRETLPAAVEALRKAGHEKLV